MPQNNTFLISNSAFWEDLQRNKVFSNILQIYCLGYLCFPKEETAFKAKCCITLEQDIKNPCLADLEEITVKESNNYINVPLYWVRPAFKTGQPDLGHRKVTEKEIKYLKTKIK